MYDKKKLYSIAEVAAELQISEPTIRRWCTEGRIEGIKQGGRWVVPQSEIDTFRRGFAYDHENALRKLRVTENSVNGITTCKKCGRSWIEPQVCYWRKNDDDEFFDDDENVGVDLLRMLCPNGCNWPTGFSEAREKAWRIGLLRGLKGETGDIDDDIVYDFVQDFESMAQKKLEEEKGFIENLWGNLLDGDIENSKSDFGYNYNRAVIKFYIYSDSRFWMDWEIIDWLENWYINSNQKNEDFIHDLDSELSRSKTQVEKGAKGRRHNVARRYAK